MRPAKLPGPSRTPGSFAMPPGGSRPLGGSHTSSASPYRSPSEQSTAPPPKRLKSEADDRPLAITCTPCRARKIKCDSTKPVCQNCAKNPRDCVYPVKLKPGLRPGTGTDMSKRLEQLEERVATYEARLREQEAALAQVTRWQTAQVAQPVAAPSSSGSAALRGYQHDGNQFSADPHLGPSVPSQDPSHDVYPSPGGLSVASFLDPHVLPADDIVQALINLYYAHIWPWAPIIPKQSFSSPWNITVHAIVVVSLRLSDDPRLAGMKSQLRSAAKSHVLSHAIESTSIASIQALGLLALDLIGSEQGPSSWGILALLTRSAVHLGLMTEDEQTRSSQSNGPSETNRVGSLSRTSIVPPPQSWGEDEARRRLFWLIYILDRYSSASTGWDFALRDADIRRRLPSTDALWAGSAWQQAPFFAPVLHRDRFTASELAQLSPMAFLIEAVDLLGRAHTLQSRPDADQGEEFKRDAAITLSASARRWYQDLPALDGATGLCVKGIYHATMLKINAYYAYPALGGTQQPFERTCLESCAAMVDLCAQAQTLGWRSASPWFIWSAWVAARVLFISRFVGTGTHARESKDAVAAATPGSGVSAADDPSFGFVLECLRDAAQFWSLATQYVRLLEAARRRLQRNEYEPLNLADNGSLPDAIHVLLDLRRTAYNAVGHAGDSPPGPAEMNLNDLPAWAVQPLLGDLHNWFDLPAGLFNDPL